MKKNLLLFISFFSISFLTAQNCSDLFFSEYVEGYGQNKAIEIYNAHELNRNRTFNNGERGEYLTDYAYKFAENELSLSKSCRAVKVSELTYCVYTPDDDTSKAKRLIPKFSRMRRIKRVNSKYLGFSQLESIFECLLINNKLQLMII